MDNDAEEESLLKSLKTFGTVYENFKAVPDAPPGVPFNCPAPENWVGYTPGALLMVEPAPSPEIGDLVLGRDRHGAFCADFSAVVEDGGRALVFGPQWDAVQKFRKVPEAEFVCLGVVSCFVDPEQAREGMERSALENEARIARREIWKKDQRIEELEAEVEALRRELEELRARNRGEGV